jgi:hypothetical protein
MATPSTTARLTPNPTGQHGRELVVGTPGALASEASEPSAPTREDSAAVAQHPYQQLFDVINDQPRLIADSFVVPDEALDLVPGPLRQAARVTKEPSTPEEIVR